MRSEVRAAEKIMAIFWFVTSCGLVGKYQDCRAHTHLLYTSTYCKHVLKISASKHFQPSLSSQKSTQFFLRCTLT